MNPLIPCWFHYVRFPFHCINAAMNGMKNEWINHSLSSGLCLALHFTFNHSFQSPCTNWNWIDLVKLKLAKTWPARSRPTSRSSFRYPRLLAPIHSRSSFSTFIHYVHSLTGTALRFVLLSLHSAYSLHRPSVFTCLRFVHCSIHVHFHSHSFHSFTPVHSVFILN